MWLPTQKQRAVLACQGLLGRCWGRTTGGPFSRQVCKWCCSLCLHVPATAFLDGIRVVQAVVDACVCPWPCPSDRQSVSRVYQLLQSQQDGWSPELISPWETLTHCFLSGVRVRMCFLSLASFLVTSFSVQTYKGLDGTQEVKRIVLLLCDSGLHHWLE